MLMVLGPAFQNALEHVRLRTQQTYVEVKLPCKQGIGHSRKTGWTNYTAMCMVRRPMSNAWLAGVSRPLATSDSGGLHPQSAPRTPRATNRY